MYAKYNTASKIMTPIPDTVVVEGVTYVRKYGEYPEEIANSLGYYEVVYNPTPSEPEKDHHWVGDFTLSENKWVQTWTQVEDSTTPPQRRENAYKTRKCIEFGNGLLTVDEARNLCAEYQYDGTERATDIIIELSGKIADAKEAIREEYPDVVVEEENTDE